MGIKMTLFGLFLLLLLSGCSSQTAGFGFKSNDCSAIYKECMEKCSAKGESNNNCSTSCGKTESLCRAMKIKGCMQDCDKEHGKGTNNSESCKRNCQQITR